MLLVRRPIIAAIVSLFALVLLVLALSPAGNEGASDHDTAPAPQPETGEAPPAFVPVTGGTDEDGQPEPPPVHAVFSVVVRGATGWDPYSGPELTGLDDEATAVIAGRLRQLDEVLRRAGMVASIELSYGPASALCAVDPDVLDQLEDSGHRIGFYARSSGEAFRAVNALAECDRVATTASGLAAMADSAGPQPPTPTSLTDAMAILSVLDVDQVVGALSPICQDLGLSGTTHGYGTGAFTAPWRSGWTMENPCTDLVTGQIVMIDQTTVSPTAGNQRVDSASISVLRTRGDQVLAYALDRRFSAPVDLPAPGVITWGVRVWLHELTPELDPPDEPDVEPETADADDPGTASATDGTAGDDAEAEDDPPDTERLPTIDPRTAALSDETMAELSALFEEWQESVDTGRLRWMLPDEVAAIIRPR